jgi:leucyl-tRNA---protein transferase
MSEQYRQFPEFYITSPQACPYLEGKTERKLFTHLAPNKSDALVDGLLRGGFRRSQNIAYMPYCDGCNACVSVRLVIADFAPTVSMRRTSQRNGDLVAMRVTPRATVEQYAIFRAYIAARHRGGGMADMTALDYAAMVEETAITTHLTEYRLPSNPGGAPGALVAVALVDSLSDGLSLSYSFYDPTRADRSLGTYMILEHAAYAQAKGLPYLYLGYQISGSRKMAYKARFQPQERLSSAGWERSSAEVVGDRPRPIFTVGPGVAAK